jgi:methyl-accepting chemotaxis protein
MALRHIWFIISLAAAVAVAALSPGLMPSVIDWATGVRTAAFDSLFRSDDLLRIATGIALGALVLFLLVYLGLTLFDGIGVAMAQRRLRTAVESTGDVPPADFQEMLESYSALRTPAAVFIGSLQQVSGPPAGAKSGRTTLASPRPAHHYFGPHATIHSRTYRWLFDPLPVLLVAIGTGLLMLKAASALGQGSGATLGGMIEPQIAGLLLLTTSALLIYVIKRILLGIRYQQTVAFCDFVDSLFPMIGEIEHLNRLETITRDASKPVVTAVNGMSKDIGRTLDARLKEWQKTSETGRTELQDALVKGLGSALEAPVSALVQASERTGQDIAVQSRDALEAVLKAFLDGLNQTFGEQARALTGTLEETRDAAHDMHKAYRDSLEQHRASVQDSLQAYAGSFGQTAASFASLQGSIDNLLALTTPLLHQMIGHQEKLLHALEQESASAQVIGRAAGELSLAAQASRDTVEQFVTLAERLRETGKAMGGGGGVSAPPPPRGIDRDLVRQLRALKSEPGSAAEE